MSAGSAFLRKILPPFAKRMPGCSPPFAKACPELVERGGQGGNAVELTTEVGRNKPAQAGVSGKLNGEMPETVASRPYSGLRQILNSTALGQRGLSTQRYSGFILIASLLVLILLTILTLSMSGSFGLQELIAGNQNEKARALESAQSALEYAEWWLNQTTAGASNATTGASCTTVTTTTTPVICTNALSNPTATATWVAGHGVVSYTPPNMTTSTTGGSGTFYAVPMFYIQYLGASPNAGFSYMYQITAMGYGGDASSIAVVQSTFQMGN